MWKDLLQLGSQILVTFYTVCYEIFFVLSLVAEYAYSKTWRLRQIEAFKRFGLAIFTYLCNENFLAFVSPISV
jgi:hypothetical protein